MRYLIYLALLIASIVFFCLGMFWWGLGFLVGDLILALLIETGAGEAVCEGIGDLDFGDFDGGFD